MDPQMSPESDETVQEKTRQTNIWLKPSTYKIMQAIRDGLNMTWEATWTVAAEQLIQSGLLPEPQMAQIRNIMAERDANNTYIGNSPINPGPSWSQCGPLVAMIDATTTQINGQLEDLFEAIADHQNAVLSYQPPPKEHDDEYHTIQISKESIPPDASINDIIDALKPIAEAIHKKQVPPQL